MIIESTGVTMTPDSALHFAIMDYRRELNGFTGDDPHGVRAHLQEMIAALEDAQRGLAELRKIKGALTVLKGVE